MRSLVACVVIALLLPSISAARKPRCTLRVHLEGNANDSNVFASETVSPATGRKVMIAKTPAISEREVVAFAAYSARDGSFGALFQLNDHGKLALDTLSVERRGRYAYVFVNGRGVAELQIDRRITDGQLYLASGLTAQDLALMKKEWRLIGQPKK